jgi:hypothetical protein
MGSERGSAMLAALCFAMVFAIVLSSYIALCYSSLKSSTRFLMNLHCEELAESGIEQALYAQNNNDWGSWTLSGLTATQTFPITATTLGVGYLENGETWVNKVSVRQYGTLTPTISSWGIVTLPDGTTVTRELTAPGAIAPAFVNAIAATGGKVVFNVSGPSLVDSFNSNPYIAPGTGDPLNNFSAVVLSTGTFSGSVSIASGTTIQGYMVGINPSALSYTSGSSLIGPSTPHTTTVDLTRTIVDPLPFQPQFTEAVPSGGTLITISGTMSLGVSGGITPSVYYTNSDVTLANTDVLSINGPVILIIRGSSNLSVDGTVSIPAPTPANPHVSLEVHLQGGNMNISSSASIINSSQEAKRLVIMGSTNTNLQFLGADNFCGVLYFPAATVGVTANNPVIYGSIVAKSALFLGTPTFHYDLALRNPDSTYGDSAFNCFSNTATSGAIQPVMVSGVTELIPAAIPPF